jgi:hypothetical protein
LGISAPRANAKPLTSAGIAAFDFTGPTEIVGSAMAGWIKFKSP